MLPSTYLSGQLVWELQACRLSAAMRLDYMAAQTHNSCKQTNNVGDCTLGNSARSRCASALSGCNWKVATWSTELACYGKQARRCLIWPGLVWVASMQDYWTLVRLDCVGPQAARLASKWSTWEFARWDVLRAAAVRAPCRGATGWTARSPPTAPAGQAKPWAPPFGAGMLHGKDARRSCQELAACKGRASASAQPESCWLQDLAKSAMTRNDVRESETSTLTACARLQPVNGHTATCSIQ